MFPWEGEDIDAIEALMATRDPRRYRLGLVTRNLETGQHSCAWFSGRSELGHYLARVEPRRHGLEGLDYIRVRDRLQDTLAALEIRGTDPRLRASVNGLTEPVFRVAWWGTLESLRQGEDDWSRDLLSALDPSASPPLPPKRTEELIGALRELCGQDADASR